jgi:hypothetical protein
MSFRDPTTAPRSDGDAGARSIEPDQPARSPLARRYGALAEAMAKRRAGAERAGPTMSDVATAAVEGASAGAPVDGGVRAQVEPHLGADLSGVRVHADPLAQQASEAMGARAFAHGRDVFLGPGESGGDVGLMAHELTHVVQQGAAGDQVPQRQVEVGAANSPAEQQADAVAAAVTGGQRPAASGLIVSDDAPAGPGQVKRSVFLRQLKAAVTSTANDALGPLWSAMGCPYIERWFSKHASATPEQLEALARRYSGVAGAGAATDYLPPILDRVRAGIGKWKNGEDLSGELSRAGMSAEAAAASQARADAGDEQRTPAEMEAAQRKPTADSVSAPPLVAELGDGEPLPASAAARMGDAFGGESFAEVRVHTDDQAARKASALDARAFTVGNHIAFGSGEFNPGTPAGDAILAHELAHTVQQRGAGGDAVQRQTVGGESAAHEQDADRAAGGVLGRLWGGVKSAFGGARDNVGPALRSGYQLQRCSGGTKPDYDWSKDAKGDNEGAVVAQLSKKGSMVTPERDLKAGKTIGVFDSKAKALAVAKSEANAAVVIPENGMFAAYQLDSDGYFNNEIFNPVLIRNAGMVVKARISAIITASGATYTTSDLEHSPGQEPQLQTEPAGDPFAPYLEVNKEGKGGIENLDEGELIGMFQAAMFDNAIKVLAESQRQAQQKADQFAGGPTAVSASEHELMLDTARELKPAVKELKDAELELWLYDESGGGGGEPDWDRDPNEPTERDKLQEKVDIARARKGLILQRYPMLGRYQDPDDLDTFIKETKSGRVDSLERDANQVVRDVYTTRSNIMTGDLNLWTVPSVVYSTMVGLGIDPDGKQGTWIKNKASKQKSKEQFLSIALAVFSIGFGIAAAVFTGGASLAFAAGAFGVGMVDAIRTTEQHFVTNAATNTDVDTPESMLPQEAKEHWGWLIVAWAGVALDFADLAKAAKAGKVGSEIAEVAKGSKTVDEAAQVLAAGNPKLLARLRKAAGVHKVTDPVSADMLKQLEPQVGARIEIDPKTLGNSGEVRVNLKKVDDGLVVTGITVGARATVGDVLLHAETVRLLKRYNGTVGKLRELWDRFRSFAKLSGDQVVPPAGWAKNSQAYLSWYEVKKLQDIIDVKRAQLQELMKKGAPQAQQDALRRDLAFLDNEYGIHKQVVDQAASEAAGELFVAMGEGTKAAMNGPLGLRLPDFPHVGPSADPKVLQDALEQSAYYYRRQGGGFVLARKANKGGKALQPEIVDGKWTGKFIEDADKMTRLEREAALVGSWPEELRDAYKALGDAHKGKLVPVQGVAASGTSIGKLDPDFVDECAQILTPAYTRLLGGDTVAGAAKAREVAESIASHDITVVSGTEHLRAAHGYRASYFKGLESQGLKAGADGEVHHLIPLYLGGHHKELLDLEPALHKKMHELIDQVPFSEGTLAPSSIRSAGLPFDKGAAVVGSDGSVQLFKAVQSGDSWSWVAIGGGT